MNECPQIPAVQIIDAIVARYRSITGREQLAMDDQIRITYAVQALMKGRTVGFRLLDAVVLVELYRPKQTSGFEPGGFIG